MKAMRIVMLMSVLFAFAKDVMCQEVKPERDWRLEQDLYFINHTKIGKKLDQMWEQVWGGEREKQRREKYKTPEAYANRPLDPDEKELIAEMLDFAKGWRILEKERGIERERYPGQREVEREIYGDARIAVLRLLRRIKHVSMIDDLLSILWDMPPKLKEAIARWQSGQLEKEIERLIQIQDELIQQWLKKGLSENEAKYKAMEQFYQLYPNPPLHPLVFSEVRVMEEALETLASIADDRTMEELLRLLDHPLELIVMSVVQAIGLLRRDPLFLFVWLDTIRPEIEKKEPWYKWGRWERIRMMTAEMKKELIEWWRKNKGKVRLRWELTQHGLPDVLW